MTESLILIVEDSFPGSWLMSKQSKRSLKRMKKKEQQTGNKKINFKVLVKASGMSHGITLGSKSPHCYQSWQTEKVQMVKRTKCYVNKKKDEDNRPTINNED